MLELVGGGQVPAKDFVARYVMIADGPTAVCDANSKPVSETRPLVRGTVVVVFAHQLPGPDDRLLRLTNGRYVDLPAFQRLGRTDYLPDQMDRKNPEKVQGLQAGDAMFVFTNWRAVYHAMAAGTFDCQFDGISRPFGHAAMVVSGGQTTREVMVVEAGFEGIEHRTLYEALMPHSYVLFLRPRWRSDEDRHKAAQYALHVFDRGVDYDFTGAGMAAMWTPSPQFSGRRLPNWQTLENTYCSRMTFNALKAGGMFDPELSYSVSPSELCRRMLPEENGENGIIERRKYPGADIVLWQEVDHIGSVTYGRGDEGEVPPTPLLVNNAKWHSYNPTNGRARFVPVDWFRENWNSDRRFDDDGIIPVTADHAFVLTVNLLDDLRLSCEDPLRIGGRLTLTIAGHRGRPTRESRVTVRLVEEVDDAGLAQPLVEVSLNTTELNKLEVTVTVPSPPRLGRQSIGVEISGHPDENENHAATAELTLLHMRSVFLTVSVAGDESAEVVLESARFEWAHAV